MSSPHFPEATSNPCAVCGELRSTYLKVPSFCLIAKSLCGKDTNGFEFSLQCRLMTIGAGGGQAKARRHQMEAADPGGGARVATHTSGQVFAECKVLLLLNQHRHLIRELQPVETFGRLYSGANT